MHGGVFGNPHAALNVLRVEVRVQFLDFRRREHLAIKPGRLVSVCPAFQG